MYAAWKLGRAGRRRAEAEEGVGEGDGAMEMEMEKGGPVDGAAGWLDAPGEVWRFNAGTGARESGGVVDRERGGLARKRGCEPTDGRHVVSIGPI